MRQLLQLPLCTLVLAMNIRSRELDSESLRQLGASALNTTPLEARFSSRDSGL
jgi:hypothetical protein